MFFFLDVSFRVQLLSIRMINFKKHGRYWRPAKFDAASCKVPKVRFSKLVVDWLVGWWGRFPCMWWGEFWWTTFFVSDGTPPRIIAPSVSLTKECYSTNSPLLWSLCFGLLQVEAKAVEFPQAFLTVFPSIFAVMIARGAETPTKSTANHQILYFQSFVLLELIKTIAVVVSNHPRRWRPGRGNADLCWMQLGLGTQKGGANSTRSYLCHLVEWSNGWVFGSKKKWSVKIDSTQLTGFSWKLIKMEDWFFF